MLVSAQVRAANLRVRGEVNIFCGYFFKSETIAAEPCPGLKQERGRNRPLGQGRAAGSSGQVAAQEIENIAESQVTATVSADSRT
jgi:hypothetical protein